MNELSFGYVDQRRFMLPMFYQSQSVIKIKMFLSKQESEKGKGQKKKGEKSKLYSSINE